MPDTRGKPRPRWQRAVGWTALGIICLASLTAGAFVGNMWRSKVGRSIILNIARGLPAVIGNRDPLAGYTLDSLPPDKQHVVNILLMGCDSDYEDARPVAIKGSPGRSDALMIARADLDNNTVSVLSIPRDTAVRIPGHGVQKINAAHALGGPELTEETVQRVFGINADFYVELHFDGFQKIVDSVGGVNVDVDKPLNYDDNWANLHVHLQPGFQHLTGYQAMGYVRIRHSDDDLHRAERQHAFLEALKDRIESPANIMHLPQMLDTVNDSLKSDLTMDQMLALLAWVRRVPRQNVQLATLPVVEGPSYCYVKQADDQNLIARMFGIDRVVALNGDAPTLEAAVDRARGAHRRKRRTPPAAAAAHAIPQLADPDTEPLDAGDGVEIDRGSTDSPASGADTTRAPAADDAGGTAPTNPAPDKSPDRG